MSNEELVKEIQQGINTTDNMELLYRNNKGYIYKIAKRFSGYADIEELMQEAYFGLYEAVQRYESDKEVKFMSYAGFWIKQAIKRYIDNCGQIVRIPVHETEMLSKYNHVLRVYEQYYGKKPTDQYVCRILGISMGVLQNLKKTLHSYGTVMSLDEPAGEEEDCSLYEVIPGTSNFEDKVIEKVMRETPGSIWDIVRANTNDQENHVIIGRYAKKRSLESLGSELHVSRERVRQIEVKALKKLRYPRILRELQKRYDIAIAGAYRGSVGRFKNTWTSSTEWAAIKLNENR